LQDDVRTATYRSAILLNGPSHFKDKKVLDVGAGSGILSFFAAQAGASQVYAVEASKVATKMKKLVDTAGRNGRNDFLKDKITIIQGKKKKKKKKKRWCLHFFFSSSLLHKKNSQSGRL
jgi:histone-arginine methyltransferase CARM1